MELKKVLPIILISLIGIGYLSLFSYEQYLSTKSYELSFNTYKLSLNEYELKTKAHDLNVLRSVMEYCTKYKDSGTCVDAFKKLKYEK